jgi:hypothetical protein
VKQFSKLLEFVLKFDEMKMSNPALQNDFSYFRRASQRSRMSAPPLSAIADDNYAITYEEIENAIPIEVTNAMTLFFAHATPMLQCMSAAVSCFVSDISNNASVANMTTDMLSMMAKVCQKMLDTPDLKSRIQNEATEMFILRVMVGIIILYDHVHPYGAFAKGTIQTFRNLIEKIYLFFEIVFSCIIYYNRQYFYCFVVGQGPNHLDLVASIGLSQNSTATHYYIKKFFKKCFRFGNNLRDSLQFTKQMTENFVKRE